MTSPTKNPNLNGVVLDDRFRLDDLLGVGGMGAVYRGVQLSVQRPVAVKLIRKGQQLPESVERRFLREAQIMSRLSHPNIVQLLEFGETADQILYLVMELVEGISLSDLLQKGRLDPLLATNLLKQAAMALTEAEARDVVHRDLKPANLILSSDVIGKVRLRVLDFGIAFPKNTNIKITQTGLLCGTPAYLSPEQARGEDATHVSDIYGLGVVYFEMLTGKPPFNGDNLQVMFKHVQEEPPDLSDHVSNLDLPQECVDLVRWMLQKAPQDRPTASQLLDRINELGWVTPRTGNDQEPWFGLTLPPLGTRRTATYQRIRPNQVNQGSNPFPFRHADQEIKEAWDTYLDEDSDPTGSPALTFVEAPPLQVDSNQRMMATFRMNESDFSIPSTSPNMAIELSSSDLLPISEAAPKPARPEHASKRIKMEALVSTRDETAPWALGLNERKAPTIRLERADTQETPSRIPMFAWFLAALVGIGVAAALSFVLGWI